MSNLTEKSWMKMRDVLIDELDKERQRSKVLVDALTTIRSLTKQNEIVNTVIKALNTYNKT